MEDDPEVIRLQMEETRAALQDKLETLEHQVTETVQNAAEAASDTVQTVKEAVEETVGTVKGTVEEAVHSVKDTFDLGKQVKDHPWLMFVGAGAAGFVANRLLFPTQQGARYVPEPSLPVAQAAEDVPLPPHRNGSAPSLGRSFGKGIIDSLAQHYGEEVSKLRELGVGVAAAAIRELITKATPPALVDQIADIVDSLTVKLGGKPMPSSLFHGHSSAESCSEPPAYNDRERYSKAART